MMSHVFRCTVLLVLAQSIGCGTWLSLRGASVDDPLPGGIAVNERAVYRVTVEAFPASVASAPGTLVTIDPSTVGALDWRRMPFSSGELAVKLTPEQTLEEVTITGTTGAARAAGAAGATVEAWREIQKGRAESAER